MAKDGKPAGSLTARLDALKEAGAGHDDEDSLSARLEKTAAQQEGGDAYDNFEQLVGRLKEEAGTPPGEARMPETSDFEIPEAKEDTHIDVSNPIPDPGAVVPDPDQRLYPPVERRRGFVSRHKASLTVTLATAAAFTAAYYLNDDFRTAVRHYGGQAYGQMMDGIKWLQTPSPHNPFAPK
jgi:hypothetical protein